MSRFTWAPGWSGWITARSRAMRPTRLWRARFRQSVRTWRANAGFRPGIPFWTEWQQSEHKVHTVGLAPAHQLVAAEAGVSAQGDFHIRPGCPDLRHDSLDFRQTAER